SLRDGLLLVVIASDQLSVEVGGILAENRLERCALRVLELEIIDEFDDVNALAGKQTTADRRFTPVRLLDRGPLLGLLGRQNRLDVVEEGGVALFASLADLVHLLAHLLHGVAVEAAAIITHLLAQRINLIARVVADRVRVFLIGVKQRLDGAILL